MLIQSTGRNWDLNSFVVVVVAMVAVGLDVCEDARRVTFSPLKSPIVATVRHSVPENMVGQWRVWIGCLWDGLSNSDLPTAEPSRRGCSEQLVVAIAGDLFCGWRIMAQRGKY